MMKGLKRLAAGGILLRELRGIRKELGDLRPLMERIATALETSNARRWPIITHDTPGALDEPAVEVSFISEESAREFMQIELDLTAAKGTPPSEDDILQEYTRRHQETHLS